MYSRRDITGNPTAIPRSRNILPSGNAGRDCADGPGCYTPTGGGNPRSPPPALRSEEEASPQEGDRDCRDRLRLSTRGQRPEGSTDTAGS